MSPPDGLAPSESNGAPSEYTVEELGDYLDQGRTPRNEAIEQSAEAQIMLAAMKRLRALSATMMEADASAQPARDEQLVHGILDTIHREAHSGRRIPVSSDQSAARLSITEGAVRGLLRATGDRVGSVIIGRCRLLGDVTVPDEPITVRVDVSVRFGESIPDAADAVRRELARELDRHTEVKVEAIDVVVHDVLLDAVGQVS